MYAPRRIHCKRCDRVKVEHVPWARGKQRNTLHFQGFLSHWAKKLAWKQVAVEFGVHWNDVFRAVESVVTWGLKRRCLRGIKAIGVDELMIWKGHKYITVVYQIDQHCKRLLWLGRERTAESFNGFFDMLGKRRSRAIRFVCSDMWKAYLNVIAERTPKAVHILDRFHIVANLNKALDEVRAHEARRLKLECGDSYTLKKTRWCLLKKPKNLNKSQRGRLRELLSYNLKTVRAYLLARDFNHLWDYTSPIWAGKFLDQWCSTTMRSKIEPMKKIARQMRSHKRKYAKFS